MRKRAALSLLIILYVSTGFLALAEGVPPPPGWGQPKPLPAANGDGRVAFKQGGAAMTLPLNKIEIDTSHKDMVMVSLTFVDARQENKLELQFTSMPKLGKNDPMMVTGFTVNTKARGLSRLAANKGKCNLAIAKLTAQEASGSLTCSGMADMSAEKSAPEVTDVRFDGKVK